MKKKSTFSLLIIALLACMQITHAADDSLAPNATKQLATILAYAKHAGNSGDPLLTDPERLETVQKLAQQIATHKQVAAPSAEVSPAAQLVELLTTYAQWIVSPALIPSAFATDIQTAFERILNTSADRTEPIRDTYSRFNPNRYRLSAHIRTLRSLAAHASQSAGLQEDPPTPAAFKLQKNTLKTLESIISIIK